MGGLVVSHVPPTIFYQHKTGHPFAHPPHTAGPPAVVGPRAGPRGGHLRDDVIIVNEGPVLGVVFVVVVVPFIVVVNGLRAGGRPPGRRVGGMERRWTRDMRQGGGGGTRAC